MIKLKLSLLASALLVTSSLASKFETNTIDLKVGQQNLSSKSTVSYSIGYLASMTFENNLHLGVQADLQYASFDVDNSSVDTYLSLSTSADILLGYQTNIGVTPYVLLGVIVANIDGKSYQEFGYGVGTRYSLNKSWSIGAEYKNYTTGFDYSILNGFVSFSWDR